MNVKSWLITEYSMLISVHIPYFASSELFLVNENARLYTKSYCTVLWQFQTAGMFSVQIQLSHASNFSADFLLFKNYFQVLV